MSVHNSFGKELAGLIIVLMIGASIFGVLLANSEILKPYTGHRMDVETDAMARQQQIQADANAKVAAAQAQEAAKLASAKTIIEVQRVQADTQAQIAQIQEDQRMQVERNNQSLLDAANWSKVGMVLASALGLAMCAALGRGLWRLTDRLGVRQVASFVAAPAAADDIWRSDDYRARRIREARVREREARREVLKRFYPALKPLSDNVHRARRQPQRAARW